MDRFELTARIAQWFSGHLTTRFAYRSSSGRVTTCNVYQMVRRQDDPQSLQVVQEFRHMDELFRLLDTRIRLEEVEAAENNLYRLREHSLLD